MSRNMSAAAALISIALLLTASLSLTAAPKAAPAPDAAKAATTLPPPSESWRQDPACQMVFFAVLEGLYTEGVPDEVVDLIVPPVKEGNIDASVQRCFVFRCPLCHAAYEAFVLYQRRQGFHGSGEKKSTFGKGFDIKITESLRSDEPRVRVFAMGNMIRPWIEKRIKSMKLTPQQNAELLDKLVKYAGEGDQMFKNYKTDRNSIYFQWQFYGGCQACEAAKIVAKQIQAEPK